MKRIRPFILLITVVLSALVAFGLWSLPGNLGGKRCSRTSPLGFDPQRVVSDIEIISKDHHSVIHNAERTEVRQYLMGRLRELGAEPQVYTFPGLRSRGYTFDANDIVADFPPLSDGCATYLLMVAHYDSRYPWKPVRDTVCSYGAADDGYGLGVALETARCLLERRQEWKQGLRILFTDAEEVGMEGMKSLFGSNKELFEDVGLVINIEARGPFGPALLFETSEGNEALLKLYGENARYPYTYSLTNVVYSFLPNFTDFTVVKDSIPGMNFSTIADVNHYHTDKDNFSFVNASSILHYGEQILPVAAAYLTGGQYGDPDALRSDSNRVFFTVPLLGLLNFSKGWYIVLNVIVMLLFALLVFLNRGNLRGVGVQMCVSLGIALGALVAGELLAFLGCLVSGARFKLFGVVTGMGFDNILMIVSAVALLAVIVLLYWKKGKTGTRLFATALLLAILSVALLCTIGDNMFTLIPLALFTLALLLWQATSLKLFLLASVALLILHSFSFLYALSMALSVGALGAVLMIASLDLMILVGLCDCYLMTGKD